MAANDYTQKLITLTRVNSSGNLEVFYPKTVAQQVYVSETKTLQDHVDDTNIHLSATERSRLNATGNANGYALLDSNGFVPAANINPAVLAITTEFANIAALTAAGATTNIAEGQLVWVNDASGDTTVSSGWAIYRKKVDTDPASLDYTKVNDVPESTQGAGDGVTAGWQKVAESESLDVVVNWANIEGKPNSAVADIDDAVSKKHEHANKAVIDKFTESSGDLIYNGTEKVAFHSAINHFKVVAESDMATAATGMQENDFVFVTTGTFTMPADA